MVSLVHFLNVMIHFLGCSASSLFSRVFFAIIIQLVWVARFCEMRLRLSESTLLCTESKWTTVICDSQSDLDSAKASQKV